MLACQLCDKRCCKNLLITVTAFDVVRIAKAKGLKPPSFAELVEPRMLRVDWDSVLECKEGLFVLALKSHPCVFLNKDGSCSVFDVAPMACRIYPNTINGFNDTALCPLHSKVLFHIHNPGLKYKEAFESELTMYKDIVKLVSSKSKQKKECFKELLDRAEKAKNSTALIQGE